jgi:hypothetical protein
LQSYGKTSFHGGSGEKTEWNCSVAGRKVRYNIVDTSGGRTNSIYFILFNIQNPATGSGAGVPTQIVQKNNFKHQKSVKILKNWPTCKPFCIEYI